MLEQALLPGGNIEMYRFIDAYEGSSDDMVNTFDKTQHGDAIRRAFEYYARTGSLNMLEKARLDTLTEMTRSNRDDIFTPATVFAYLVSVLRQTQVMRMIIVGKLNRMDNTKLQEIIPQVV